MILIRYYAYKERYGYEEYFHDCVHTYSVNVFSFRETFGRIDSDGALSWVSYGLVRASFQFPRGNRFPLDSFPKRKYIATIDGGLT